MKSGLLWYDTKSLHIIEKIERAAKRYQEKFGYEPNVAMVNPKMLENGAVPKLKNISVEAKASIMPNHIWLGRR